MLLKLSIIIPVYNAEKFICKCLTSLLDQTLKEMEIIVVDDRGLDNSMQLVRELKERVDDENRIRIIEMPHNSGAAAARNYGLKYAQGEYVAFVDSDDWCEPAMYETLYRLAKEGDCDWCYADAVKEYPDGKKTLLRQPEVPSGELTAEILKTMLSRFVAYFWTSIYKRDFLTKNHIEFPLYRFSEDSFFVWKVVMHAQRFATVNETFYHYIVQPNSVSNIYDGTKHQQKVEVFSLLINDLRDEQKYLPYKAELDYLYIKKGLFIPLCICAIYAHENLSQQLDAIFHSAELLIPNYKDNAYLKTNAPLRFLLPIAKKIPRLFRTIMRMYSKNKREMF